MSIQENNESLADSGGTRGRIIDAAEFVFAEQGYENASVRNIMRVADAPLGLLSYYFGSKDALLEAVVARRASTLSRMRLKALDAIPADAVSIETLVAAYYGTVMDIVISGDDGWRAYVRVLTQLSTSDRRADLVEKHFLSTGERFIDRLRHYAPGASPAQAAQAWRFGVSAALFLFADAGRSRASFRPVADDFRVLSQFIAGGLRASLGLSAACDDSG